jgi:3-hydroxyacyl-[acyl-carrier-protein] dehydratase
MEHNEILAALAEKLDRAVVSAGECTVEMAFDTDFPGFAGHFPGNPVVPGVCLIEVFRLLADRSRGKETRIGSIRKLKFFHPLLPGITAEFRLRITRRDGRAGGSGIVSIAGEKAAQVEMEWEETDNEKK